MEAELQRAIDLSAWFIIVRLGGCLGQAVHLRAKYQDRARSRSYGWELPSCKASKARRPNINVENKLDPRRLSSPMRGS